ncbi:hypothetical protein GCM10017559_33740 [Streptosporangium longisporum]|uniref:Uncharacterized protein n=1 Tax=Streptosporangium longisporum TaxID=46187 RepID=A0ABP6KIP3_9ACTN
MHAYPEVIRVGYESADWNADDRRHLLTKGMQSYTNSGVIGRPSLATAEKARPCSTISPPASTRCSASSRSPEQRHTR